MANERVHIEISTASVLKGILLVTLFIFLYILKDVIVIFLFALVIGSAVSPFANWLDEKGFPRILGVLFLYLVILGLVILVFSLIVPYISNDITQLVQSIPKVVERVSSQLENVQSTSPRYLDFLSEIQNILESIVSFLQQSSQSVFSLVVSIFGGFFSFIAILIISFYLSVTRKGIETFLGSVVPEKYESYTINLWKRAELKVGRWLQGQLLLSLIMGLIVYVGLSFMHIKYALFLGLITMVLELVPMVGPVVAAIPAVFLAFIQSPSLGLWVILFYIVAQQLENHVLVPLVLGKTLGLNPIVVIIALLVGQKLAGIPGMILSVPVATIIVEMLEDVARQKESRRTAG